MIIKEQLPKYLGKAFFLYEWTVSAHVEHKPKTHDLAIVCFIVDSEAATNADILNHVNGLRAFKIEVL